MVSAIKHPGFNQLDQVERASAITMEVTFDIFLMLPERPGQDISFPVVRQYINDQVNGAYDGTKLQPQRSPAGHADRYFQVDQASLL
jgi:hypothetical protein